MFPISFSMQISVVRRVATSAGHGWMRGVCQQRISLFSTSYKQG